MNSLFPCYRVCASSVYKTNTTVGIHAQSVHPAWKIPHFVQDDIALFGKQGRAGAIECPSCIAGLPDLQKSGQVHMMMQNQIRTLDE